MGYTTDLLGQFDLDKPLSKAHNEYLAALAYTRRMKRDPERASELDDPKRKAVGLPIGNDGEYYVGSEADGDMGQVRDPSIVDYNDPPKSQPSLWCQWVPSNDGKAIVWDEGEKFYEYVPWLEYLIERFLKPWGYTVNGQVRWHGEDPDDRGILDVTDNVVKSAEDQITNVLSGVDDEKD